MVGDTVHDSVAGTFESHRYVENSTGQSYKELNRLVRQARVEASGKLHYSVLSDPVFVSLRVPTRLSLRWDGKVAVDGSAAPCCPICWQARRCPRAATQAQEETEFIRLLWLEIVQGGYDDTMIDEEISRLEVGSLLTQKGCF